MKRFEAFAVCVLVGLVLAAGMDACAVLGSDYSPTSSQTVAPFVAPTAMPFAGVNGVIAQGQSLVTGVCGSPAVDTDASANWQLSNDAGYILSDGGLTPIAGWSLVHLKAPERTNEQPGGATTPYPGNIPNSETPDVTFSNCVQALGLDAGFPAFTTATSNVGQGGAAYDVIKQGGTGNAYQASLNEAQVYTWLVPDAGLGTFGEIAVELVHGQANANDPGYEADLVQYNAAYNGDSGIPPITGQAYNSLPFIIQQQNAFPPIGSGENLSALADVTYCQANTSQCILSQPQYPIPGCGDNAHLINTSYSFAGEGDCYAWFQWYLTGSWHPLWPTTHSTSGNVVTLHLAVPFGPIVASSAFTAPHGAGKTYGSGGAKFPASNGWTGADGFEAWNCGETGVPIDITSVVFTSNPSGANVDAVVTITASSHIDTICYAHTPDDTSSGDYTGNCPSNPGGRCGVIRDSLNWTGIITGQAHNDYLVEFCLAV